GWWQASDGKWYPPETDPPNRPAPSGVGYPPAPPAAAPAKRGCGKTALIIGVILLAGLVGCVALLGGAADEASKDIEERDAEIAKDAELIDCRAGDPWLEAEIRVTNNSSERSNYSVDVIFESEDGATQYGSGSAYVNGLAPGQTKTEVASSLEDVPDGPFRCEITDVFRMSDE
ncbi:MAG: hypothetical protein ACO1PW_14550, partial [Actinomycetota bacterium]